MEEGRQQALNQMADTYRVWGRHPGLYAAQDWVTFMTRHREMRRRAVEALAPRPGDRVLEVGCGTGRNIPYLMEAIGSEGILIGVDYTPEMLDAARELVRRNNWPNVTLIQGDAVTRDLDEASFDGILSVLAMSCMPNHLEALQRCRDVLRSGRRLAVCDARPFPGRLKVLNPLIRPIYKRTAGWDPDRDIASDMRATFGNVEVETFNCGSFFIAVSRKERRPARNGFRERLED